MSGRSRGNTSSVVARRLGGREPGHLVDEPGLDLGPPVADQAPVVGDTGEEELFVLEAALAGEVEDRRPRDDRTHEVLGRDPQTGLFEDLTDRSLVGALPRVDAPADGEPPVA